ncbi:export membrane protein SecD [Aeromicrobium marinum DSM 15272]|uniref:Multifunctional fusion protein n=1 Tax=Aeromicrobium marinum DSM 15272 TaxID=585531 RepID=E2S996_9ACTN|nr:protein translocase subunit SecD [Aeromicrobium marinum]EFQ83820.1 export membrane protein SecD [Aeromicrobium marinum DSM 15272]
MRFTSTTWRALAALAVIAGVLALAFTQPAQLGLDLRGGTQIVFETQSTDRVEADAESTDRALEVIRGRVDALGVAEPSIARSGERRIIVELPGLQDPREAAETIGQTAQLSFHEVIQPVAPGQGAPEGQLVVPDEQGTRLLLGPVAVDGEGVSDAAATTVQQGLGEWVVNVDFAGPGRDGWNQLVAAACANTAGGQRVAIVLDDQIISSPAVQPSLCASGGGNSTQITGNFTQETAEDLSVLIKGGALPVPLELIEQRTVGATLGEAAIDASIEAAIIGIILTGLFIVLVYRVIGFLATLALASYALIAFGLLVGIGATLTLPGLAGFVLAIGLAIDANVLVFERAREEYTEHPDHGLAPALKTGFSKAWSAILDSNVTTLIAAALLFFLASGPVKGFGVTLSIGVIASMVSALVIARVLTEFAVKRSVLRSNPGVSGISRTGRIRQWLTESGPDLMRRSGTWLAITAAVAVVSIGGIVVRGLDLGVEFTGGRLLEYSTGSPVDVEVAREAVSDAGFPRAIVQESSSDGVTENITVRVEEISDDEAVAIEEAVGEVGDGSTKIRDELLTASLGQELRNKALIAFAIAISAQMLYLSFRFRWTYAVAAQVSMVSVVLTVVGIFAWWGKPIDGVFLAAVLSIIGLAVNDTIVIFDRIRERTAENVTRPLREVVNSAILQTIPRTINTGLGAIFILAALAVLGGDSLKDFAIALILGLSIGILSTIFTASALAIVLEERWPYDPEAQPEKAADPYAHIDDGRSDGAVI